jgi:hypothetical protein
MTIVTPVIKMGKINKQWMIAFKDREPGLAPAPCFCPATYVGT